MNPRIIFSEWYKRLPPTDKRSAVRNLNLLLAMMLALVFYVLFFEENISHALNAYQNLVIQQKLLNIKQDNYDNYDVNTRSLWELDKNLEDLTATIVPYNEISSTFEQITDLMFQCGIKETYFFSGDYIEFPSDSQTNLFIINTYLSGEGDYRSVLAFIDALNNMDVHFNIDNMELFSNETRQSAITLKLHISFSAYQLASSSSDIDEAEITNEKPFN